MVVLVVVLVCAFVFQGFLLSFFDSFAAVGLCGGAMVLVVLTCRYTVR